MINISLLNNSFTKCLLFALFASIGLFSCEDSNSDLMNPSFDRGPLLASVADELIIPNFTSLQTSVDHLSQAADAFVQNTTEANLTTLRAAWVQAVTDHQHCSAFGFGPAALLLGPYAEVLGVFPVDEQQVEQNIRNSNFDLPNSFDRDVRGYFAIEYLIFGQEDTKAAVTASFDQDHKDYLLLIVEELKTTVDQIVNEWNSTYRQTFIENDGTSAGSSISLYYNAFVKDYENLKNFKLELPAGLTAGQSRADGTLVEAFYSGISRDLLEAHFESSKNIWFGQTRRGSEMMGFDTYLETVVGGPALVENTKGAILEIDNAIAALPSGPLSDHVGGSEVKNLRDLMQANTANFKSSMSSLLGISITFNSGDGD